MGKDQAQVGGVTLNESGHIRALCVAVTALVLLLTPVTCSADVPAASLDTGFLLLYNLDFPAAQKQFSLYQQQHPDDPMGPVSEAAGLLFSEFDRLGVLESKFFTKNSSFKSRPKEVPDPALHDRFEAALQRSEVLAQPRLARDPADRNALLAVTLTAGLRADYASLIEDRGLAALHYTSDATKSAQKLLAVCANCYDAYVATGVSRYLIGTLSPPLRWVLRLGGYDGNKDQGINELRLAATHGRYLAPFARILLAVAYLREKQTDAARQLLQGLRTEFPANPLFSRELARLDQQH